MPPSPCAIIDHVLPASLMHKTPTTGEILVDALNRQRFTDLGHLPFESSSSFLCVPEKYSMKPLVEFGEHKKTNELSESKSSTIYLHDWKRVLHDGSPSMKTFLLPLSSSNIIITMVFLSASLPFRSNKSIRLGFSPNVSQIVSIYTPPEDRINAAAVRYYIHTSTAAQHV